MPVTPGGRFSPSDSDEWDLTTHLAAMQVSNETATANDIANAARYRTLTNSQRLGLTGASLTEGLLVYTTDTRLNHLYTNGAWVSETPWATLTLANGFTHSPRPLQWRRTLSRVMLRGDIYRATAPTAQTAVTNLPAVAPSPVSIVYASGRPDISQHNRLSGSSVSLQASQAVTTGFGYTFDGFGFDL